MGWLYCLWCAGQVSAEAKDLIRALLERDPEKRLGGKKGAAEIRAHPFFADIDWALIRHKVSCMPRSAASTAREPLSGARNPLARRPCAPASSWAQGAEPFPRC